MVHALGGNLGKAGWGGQIDQGCQWVGGQRERFHLLSYSYATGSKARTGSPHQHLGDGGSFVGALEGSVVGGQGLLEAQWLGFSLASSFPELPDFSLTFSCLPPSTFQAISPPNPKLLSDPQGTAVPSSSVSWSPAEVPPSPG